MSQMASPQGSRSGSGDVLASLTPIERGLVLDALLVAHPELSDEAEALASGLLSSPSADQVAFEVELALTGIPLEDLAARAGRVPGRGYVHETDAAWELIEEVLAPFLADLERRITLDFLEAAATVAVGIVAGCTGCENRRLGACWPTPARMRRACSRPTCWTAHRSLDW